MMNKNYTNNQNIGSVKCRYHSDKSVIYYCHIHELEN